MKQFALSFGLLLCLLPAALGVLFLGEKQNRSTELDRALGKAMEQSLRNTYLEGSYAIRNEQEAVTDILLNLLLQLKGNPELELLVLEADYGLGLFDLEVKACYPFPLTRGIRVQSRQTLILDKKAAYE